MDLNFRNTGKKHHGKHDLVMTETILLSSHFEKKISPYKLILISSLSFVLALFFIPDRSRLAHHTHLLSLWSGFARANTHPLSIYLSRTLSSSFSRFF